MATNSGEHPPPASPLLRVFRPQGRHVQLPGIAASRFHVQEEEI
jgi:hypothetical protein